MSLQTTFGPARATTCSPQRCGRRCARVATWLRLALSLLRGWRERVRSRRALRNLYELDDHILQDIGLTRAALRCEAEKPFWR